MDLKLSTDLYLGLQELNHFKESLKSEGYVKILQNSVFSYGVVKSLADTNFTNLKVYESSIDKIGIRKGLAIDSSLNIIELENDLADKFTLPNDDVIRYVVIKYGTKSKEKGNVSIQADGSIIGNGTEFISRLRGLPNRPSRIKLHGVLNTSEYNIQAVQSDTLASLNITGSDFTVENNIEYSVVGTFTPGVTVLEANKYPFVLDSYEIELRDSNVLAEGEYLLANVQYNGVRINIFDQRLNNKFSLIDESLKPITDVNKLAGVEQITYDNVCSTMHENMVKIGWGLESRSGQWTINTATQELTLNSAKGGSWQSLTPFQDGDFDDWYAVFESTGQVVKIESSEKIGSAVNLKLSFVQNYTTIGNVLITPNADFVEITILNTSSPNADKRLTFASISRYAIIPVISGTESIIQYRHLTKDQMSLGRTINDGAYLQEPSFDESGLLSTEIFKNYFNGLITPIKSKNNLYDRLTCNFIRMWSGSIADIPKDYFLCDGQNGTVDLRGKFVVGVDPRESANKFKTVGETGGSTEVTLTEAQIPTHGHDGTAKGFDHAHNYRDGYYPEKGLAQPLIEPYGVETQPGKIQGSGDSDADNLVIIYKNRVTESSGELQGTIETSQVGGGEPHENLPPYYTLCFIMRPCNTVEENEVQGNLIDLSKLKHYKNDADAATNGVAIGKFYLAAKPNTLGLSFGTVKRREV